MKTLLLLTLRFIVISLMLINSINAQITVTVGTLNSGEYNSSTQYPTAYSKLHGSTHYQVLLRNDELIAAGAVVGNITAMGFNVYMTNACGSINNFVIKIKQVNISFLPSINMDNTGFTQVYSSTSFTPVTGWNIHNFSTPFAWNGTSGLLFDICNTVSTPVTANASTYYTVTSPAYYETYTVNADETINQCNVNSILAVNNIRPTIQLKITANGPSCANLTTPVNNATSLPINTTLAWTNGGNTTSYDVYFGTNPNPPFKINQTGLTYNPGTLYGNTTYYWKIVARNANGIANGCVTRSFTTGSDCPSNLIPLDGVTNQTTYQTLTWNAVPLTTKYYIYFGTQQNPALYDSTSNTTYSIADLMGNTTYYWKIVPRNQNGLVTGCTTSSFTTRNTNHWFIKANGNDALSGNCWNNAKQDLSAVLLSASSGDVIYIAAGTYYPSRDKLNNTLPSNLKDYCFTINQSIKLMGGFPSGAVGSDLSSSLLVSRDPIANPTILSGNIGTNDSLDNCYHVVWVESGYNAPSVIDGLNITMGYANGSSSTYSNCGGGIYALSSKFSIINCVLIRNYAKGQSTNYGGGIYSNYSILSITNSTITNNYGLTQGNAIYSGGGSSSLTIKSSTISNSQNTSTSAVYLESYSNLIVDNCTFWNNVYQDIRINSYGVASVPIITNSTLENFYISTSQSPSSNQFANFNNTICKTVNTIGTFIYTFVNSGSTATYYNGNGVVTTGYPAISNWLNAPSNNGGTTKTCLPRIYQYKNSAVGMGNPAFAGLPDQRGIIRASLPCVGAVEVPYGLASDIIINDTIIYTGSNVTLTVKSNTITNPVFEWYTDASLSTHVYTGHSYTTSNLNSTYYYYLTVHNNNIFPNPQPLAKKVTVSVTQKPIITQQPVSAIQCLGDSTIFTVNSYGAGLSYQWTKNNLNLNGQINNTLNLNNIQFSDSGFYFCKVSNSYGTTNSDTVQFIVHTIPEAASTITGYSDICQGLTDIKYRIPVITGANSYSWSLPVGATGSSNKDSILISYSSFAQSGNIIVYGNNHCGNGTPSSFYITIGNFIPINPGAISGDTIVCLNQNSVTYSISPLPNANYYIWTLPNGTTGTSTSNSITVDFDTTAVSGNITVKGVNSCGEGPVSSLAINVNPLVADADSISGPIHVCKGQNSVTYSIPLIPNATSYIWTLPTGVSGTSITNSITVNFDATAINSNISVKGHNSCGDGTESSISIIIDPFPSNAGIISGTTTVCQGQNAVIYTIPVIANAISYLWTLPLGVMGTSDSNSITVNYGISAISGNISVKGNNLCGEGINSSIAITVNPLPGNAGVISGNTTVCQGQTNVNYTIPSIANTTSYLWSLPAGAIGTSTTNSITVNYDSTAVNGNITINGINSCGNGNTSSIAITVNPLPSDAGTITGNTSVCQGQNLVTYTVPAITYATSYLWTLPTGSNGSSISNTINVNYGTSAVSGNITVKGQNTCGYGIASLLPIVVNTLPTTINTNTASFNEDFQNGIPTSYTIYSDNYIVHSSIGASFPNGWNEIYEPGNTSNHVAASPSYFVPPAQANRWMITSAIIPVTTSQLTWRAKSQDTVYLDGYLVKISTTGINKSDFTTTLFSTSAESKNWTSHTVSLAIYAGQSIHIAFIQNSIDKFILLVDDISISPVYNPSVINGFSNVCSGSTNQQYTVNPLQNVTSYIWSLPTGITGSSTTNSISVNVAGNAQSGLIKVRGQNLCGVSDSLTKAIIVKPTPATPVIVQNANTLSSNTSTGNQWYNLVAGIINNATSQTYNPVQIGNYFTIITLNGCSSDSSNIIFYDNTGINEKNLYSDGFNIYPNPAKDNLIVELQGIQVLQNTSISIYNIEGQLIKQLSTKQTKTEIDIHDFPTGLYVVKVNNEKEILVSKFVKK